MNLRSNALVLALITATLAVLGDWSGSSLLARLWLAPAGLLLAGLAYESWVVHRARLLLTIEAPSQWFLGRTSRVRMHFEHDQRRGLTLEFAPAAPRPFNLDFSIRTFSIPAAAQALVEVPVTPRQTGNFVWPEQRIRVVGPLGLASWSRRQATEYGLRVLPDLSRTISAGSGLAVLGNRVTARRGAGTELLQLRRYEPGDPPRFIDWKGSARARRLISRDFSEDQHLEVVIVVDTGRASSLRAGELDRLGHYVNVAASLAQHVVGCGDMVGLVLYADRPLVALPPARGTAAVTRLRRMLAGAQAATCESSPLEAVMRVRSLVRQRSLVVLLTDLDDAAVASQLLGAVRLLQPKHLPFVAGLSSAAAESLSVSKAGNWLDPYAALAAQEYCTGLERKVQAMRAMGAPALTARPEQLERAVLEAYANFRQRRRV